VGVLRREKSGGYEKPSFSPQHRGRGRKLFFLDRGGKGPQVFQTFLTREKKEEKPPPCGGKEDQEKRKWMSPTIIQIVRKSYVSGNYLSSEDL